METNDNRRHRMPHARLSAGEEVRAILASRAVQGVLAATVLATLAGAWGRTEVARPATVMPAEAAALVAPLVPVEAVETMEEAWRRRAVERESERLAAKYVRQGYTVTPELAVGIGEAALRHDIDPEIAFGLVRAESSFRNNATSPVGAVGLTQLMPRTAAWVEPGVSRSELRDPETNLDIGFRYLRYLLDKYDGNEDLALLAYNRGPGTVDRALRRGLNPDNGYAAFVRGEPNHGHRLFTSGSRNASRRGR